MILRARPVRWARQVGFVCSLLLLAPLGTIGFAQCARPLGDILDPVLQLDLLTRYVSLDVDNYPSLEDLREAGPEPTFPCLDILNAIAEVHPELDPPSLATDRLERRLGATHARWYLVSLSREAGEDPEMWTPNPDRKYGEAAYYFPDIRTVMIHAANIWQFRNIMTTLSQHIRDGHQSARPAPFFVSENFPMVLAQAPGPTSAEPVVTIQSPHSGEGLAIAILDTGVDPTYFASATEPDTQSTQHEDREQDTSSGNRLLYQACFSSKDLYSHGEDEPKYFTSLCPSGVPALYVPIMEDPATTDYAPVEALGEDGGPCRREDVQIDVKARRGGTDRSEMDDPLFDVEECLHGTRVAYVAAGIDPNLDGDDYRHPPGIAPAAEIISLRVVSLAPPGYCDGNQPCIVIMPVDALRAMQHLADIHDDTDIMDGHDVVAANLSFQLSVPCPTADSDDDAESLHGNAQGERSSNDGDDAGTCKNSRWELRPYEEPCAGPFADAVEALLSARIWPVIAAGNHPENAPTSTKIPGFVGLPGCVGRAVTVSSIEAKPVLYFDAKFAHFVDFVAPGFRVGSPVVSDPAIDIIPTDLKGTSYAAPVVSGALALARNHLSSCSPGSTNSDQQRFRNELSWLMSQRRPMAIDVDEAIHAANNDARKAYLADKKLAKRMTRVVHMDDSAPCPP